MKEKKALYEKALSLLEEANSLLQGEPELSTINLLMASVVKNFNNIIIKELTGIKSEHVK